MLKGHLRPGDRLASGVVDSVTYYKIYDGSIIRSVRILSGSRAHSIVSFESPNDYTKDMATFSRLKITEEGSVYYDLS